MREIVKLGIRLFVFALIAAVALAATNEVTKGPIAEQAEQAAISARAEVLPGADEYQPIEMDKTGDRAGIDQVCRVLKDGQLKGYTMMVTVNGYKGPIQMTLGINLSGSINGLSINSQNESAGVGTRVTKPQFLNQFPGKAADPDAIWSEVDALTGATVSSNAVISGVEQGLRYAHEALALEPKAGEVITKESLNQFAALEARTGASEINPLSAFESIGFPDIVAVYEAKFNEQNAYVFELNQGTIILARDGTLLMRDADQMQFKAVARYYDQFLKGGAAQ